MTLRPFSPLNVPRKQAHHETNQDKALSTTQQGH